MVAAARTFISGSLGTWYPSVINWGSIECLEYSSFGVLLEISGGARESRKNTQVVLAKKIYLLLGIEVTFLAQ